MSAQGRRLHPGDIHQVSPSWDASGLLPAMIRGRRREAAWGEVPMSEVRARGEAPDGGEGRGDGAGRRRRGGKVNIRTSPMSLRSRSAVSTSLESVCG